MSAAAANLVDYAPEVPLRQWVLTAPFAWRARLGYDATRRHRAFAATARCRLPSEPARVP